jgi:glucose 1-dehydrogenase
VAFAAAGADVLVNYHTHPEDAGETARLIEAHGRRAVVVPGDVSARADVARLVDTAVEQFGRLDIAVANAYRSIRAPFLELTPEAFEQTLAVTLFGTFHTCQLAAQQMARQGDGGTIILISSVHAEQPFARSTAYNTAKAGINHMAGTMATELAPYRIRVNVINPGWIDTPGERTYATEEQIREEGQKLPWGRLGTIEEIGAVAAFISSPAASYMSGAVVRVDGALIPSLTRAR